jgi:hypothetical protein
MKIHEVKLNNKNFWNPFFIFWILSSLFLSSSLFFLYYGDKEVNSPQMVFLLIENIIVISLLTFPSVFFIIKRLLSNKPKKVFYFELPILIIIYSVFYIFNQGIGLMLGGPIDTTFLIFLKIITLPIILLTVWLVLLTTSLYFYYKKKILKK